MNRSLHLVVAAFLFSIPAMVIAAEYPSMGSIERKDPALDALLGSDAKIEKLAEGFDWAEGPVWIKKEKHLLFSDVPRNIVYKWKEGQPLEIGINPSGYTGSEPRGGEPGSNGLTLDPQGRVVLCEHGDRRIGRIEKDGSHVTIVDRFEGKRFNSPNDVCFDSKGNMYFTDPPYGLVKRENDPKRELDFFGVYRFSKEGKLSVLTKEMSRPNGIALSPDEKTLYVANSDPKRPIWMAFDLKADGTVSNGRVLFDSASLMSPQNKGLPDGFKVDRQGNLWATGPGGVLIISPQGKHLGTLRTEQATANTGWGNDGSVLYITADYYLCRIKTKTKGAEH